MKRYFEDIDSCLDRCYQKYFREKDRIEPNLYDYMVQEYKGLSF